MSKKVIKGDGINFEISSSREAELTNGEDALIVFFKIENKSDKSKSIEIGNVSMVRNNREQFERDSYLSGYLGGAGSIKANAFKTSGLIFLTSQVGEVTDGYKLYIEVTDEKLGKKYELKYYYSSSNWLVEDCTIEEIEKRITPSQLSRSFKRNIERLEALEEKFGIYLDNISVRVDESFCLSVLGEIYSSESSNLNNDIYLTVNLYDGDGCVIATENQYFDSDDFFGYDVFEIKFYDDNIALETNRIRLFPKKS